MKVRRYELYSALQLACKLAEKPTQRGSSNFGSVRLSTLNSNDKLEITACGHDTFITIDVPHIDAYRLGKLDVLIPAHDLLAIVKPATKKDTSLISFERTDGINGIDIVTSTGRFNFPLVPGENFPTTPVWRDKSIVVGYSARKLADALDFCLPAVLHDETRPHINCVAFVDRNMVATDGHRLHVCELHEKMPTERTIDEKSAKVLHSVVKLLDPYDLVDVRSPENGATLFDNWLHFITNNAVVSARIGSHPFPPYEQVIPAVIETYRVRTAELLAALKAALTADKSMGIMLDANGTIAVKLETHDRNFSTVVNPIHSPDKKLVRIGVLPRYMVEALNTTDETISVQIDGPLDPIVLRHGTRKLCGCTAVIMPMRI